MIIIMHIIIFIQVYYLQNDTLNNMIFFSCFSLKNTEGRSELGRRCLCRVPCLLFTTIAASPRRPPVATPCVALDPRMVATCRADAAEFSGPHIRSGRHRFAFPFLLFFPAEARRLICGSGGGHLQGFR